MKAYLRAGGTAQPTVQFVVNSKTGFASNYSTSSIISGNIGTGFSWKTGSTLLGSRKLLPIAASGGSSYLAFRFATGLSTFDYGWAALHTYVSDSFISVNLRSAAFAENGGPIYPGQTSIPEPASASLLAMGAMALGARGVRRMKKAQAKMKSAA